MGGKAKRERISIREYARRRRVSHEAVRKAIAAGRIRTTSDGRIDPVIADRDWGRTSRPSANGAGSYYQARARKEAALAELRELEVAERRRDLVRRSDVLFALDDFMVRLRQAVMAGASRYAHRIECPCRDRRASGELLDSILRSVLVDADVEIRGSVFVDLGLLAPAQEDLTNGEAKSAGRRRRRTPK